MSSSPGQIRLQSVSGIMKSRSYNGDLLEQLLKRKIPSSDEFIFWINGRLQRVGLIDGCSSRWQKLSSKWIAGNLWEHDFKNL
ncbi:hypothetical protein AVEN_86075-1 [Araneus ventricosus]|uniref:Uncharacterized protein n=1 Tax=Araneus ventricosus TaxID=182803 RepID=A0A4Y2IN52_ARAVE|nr:hypothetical protein AVEN_86075-1 [Araneus ventricosus]